MLKELSTNHTRLSDTFFLDWLEIGPRLMVPSSPLQTPTKKLRSSVLDIPNSKIFSEEAKQLKSFLLSLKEAEETSSLLKEIQEYFCSDVRKKLSPEDVSRPLVHRLGRFLLGDPESKEGFLALALQERNVGHYTCGHFLETLCRLYSQSLNPHYEKFCKVLRVLSCRQIKQMGLLSHAGLPGLKKCKLAAFEFLTILLQVNPKLKLEELIEEPKAAVAYSSWRAKQQMLESCMMPSYRIEAFQLDPPVHLPSSLEGSARFNTHSKETSLQTDSAQSGASSGSLGILVDVGAEFVKNAHRVLLETNPEGLGFYSDRSRDGRGFLRLNLKSEDIIAFISGQSTKNRSKGSIELAESTQSGSNSAKGSEHQDYGVQLVDNPIQECLTIAPSRLSISTDKHLYSLDIHQTSTKTTADIRGLCIEFGPRVPVCLELEVPHLCLTKHSSGQKERSAEVPTGFTTTGFVKMSFGQPREHFLSEDAGFKVVKCTLKGSLTLPEGFRPDSANCLVEFVFYPEDADSNQGFLQSLGNLTPKCLEKVALAISSRLIPGLARKDS